MRHSLLPRLLLSLLALTLAGEFPTPHVLGQAVPTRPQGNRAVNMLPTIDLHNYGAVGNGIADDTAAIQAAIEAAKVAGNANNGTGATVYFPPGTYSIRAPLILPRTGATPQNVVWLVGDNTRSCQIIGHPSFPANRALIEWDQSKGPIRTWLQLIKNLTLVCPNVAGTRAIFYDRINTGTRHDDYHPERLQLDLANLEIEASNQYHAGGVVRIEGGIWFSNWENVGGEFG